ncbi:MAG: hypothetical protein AB1330_13135 [Bacillota bacterium]
MWKRLLYGITYVIAALTLAACASPGAPPTALTARTAPALLMTPCLPPEKPITGTLGELLENYTETAMRLRACMDKHKALTEWVKHDAGQE